MSKPKSPVKVRRRWQINPQTRVKKSARIYSRSRVKKLTHRAIRETHEKGT